MLLNGKSDYSKQQSRGREAFFFLDECLPYQLAYFLESIHYPITSWHKEFQGQQGVKESPLIQYLGAQGYTWITKDAEAKREHEPEIRTAKISVVWVHGLERVKGQSKKNKVSVKDVHKMLTAKLDDIKMQIDSAKHPLFFLLYIKSSGQPVCRKISLEQFFKECLPKDNTQ